MKYLTFSRQFRLKTKAEFKNIFDQPNKISQKYVTILFKPNQKNYSRIGIIVAKRIAHHAHDRNRIKRIIKDSFRCHKVKLLGKDIIIIAKQPSKIIDKKTLRQGIDHLWEKLLTQ